MARGWLIREDSGRRCFDARLMGRSMEGDGGKMRKAPILGWFLVGMIAVMGTVQTAAQQRQVEPIPARATEHSLIKEIERLREADDMGRNLRLLRTIDYVDALLDRYPETDFRGEALTLKLAALAGLSRVHSSYAGELLSLTEQIASEKPTGRLASENAYYAIQAFVHAARLEDMPEQARMFGTQERYVAFLEDYPDSSRAPVLGASLVRNLLAVNEVGKAREWLAKLQKRYPDSPATRRAEGEVRRVDSVGKPFRIDHKTADGKAFSTGNYTGKVVVVHVWATWSDEAMRALPLLGKLQEELKDKGLQLIGINVDKKRKLGERGVEVNHVTWPQVFQEKGLRDELPIKYGVARVPSYFVIDRKGVLRSIDPGDKLVEMVRELLAVTPGAEPEAKKAEPGTDEPAAKP